MKKLIDFFYNSGYSIKLWYYLRKETRELRKNKGTLKRKISTKEEYDQIYDQNLKRITDLYDSITIEHDQVQELYLQGIKKIKRKINTKATTKEEYDATLKQLDSLCDLATKYEDSDYLSRIETLRKVYVYQNEASKEVMVDQRIKAMYELQADKEKRQKLREQRKSKV